MRAGRTCPAVWLLLSKPQYAKPDREGEREKESDRERESEIVRYVVRKEVC